MEAISDPGVPMKMEDGRTLVFASIDGKTD